MDMEMIHDVLETSNKNVYVGNIAHISHEGGKSFHAKIGILKCYRGHQSFEDQLVTTSSIVNYAKHPKIDVFVISTRNSMYIVKKMYHL
jgi:hypothetical protein